MGYYIQGPNFGKAKFIVKEYDGEIVSYKTAYDTFMNTSDKAVIVVIDNGMFEAAGFAYSLQEFKEFTYPDDFRPKQFVLIDKDLAYKLTNYK